MNDQELQKCPWCHPDDARQPRVLATSKRLWQVLCGSCGCLWPVAYDRQTAIDKWNGRRE